MTDRMRLPWHDTLGGPHLVIPQEYAAFWEGGQVPSRGRIVEATIRYNSDEPATDYDRACSVKGWLGAVGVGSGQALVLSGDLMSATYYQPQGGRHFILRWMYADSETELLDFFHDKIGSLERTSQVEFRHPGGVLFLMDSVDTPMRWLRPHREFTLPRGQFLVRTSFLKGEETALVIHEFTR